MSSKNDISLIKKYLAGKLDAHAMHQLERRSQDDPFLMDALEGYEKAGVKQPQLDDLSNRLQERINKKEAKIIPWQTWSIAASVLAVLTIGGLWVYNTNEPQPKALVAKADKVEVKQSPLLKEAEVKANIDSVVKHSEPVAVLKAPVPAAPLRSRRLAANNTESEAAYANKEINVNMLSATLDKQEQPVAKPEEKRSASDLAEIVVADYAYQRASARKAEPVSNRSENLLSGKVVDKKDGSPLPGVSVVAVGTKTGAITDKNGDFKIKADSITKVNIGYIGYKGRTIDAKDLVAYKSIPLEATDHNLNEVVVVGYGTQRKESVTAAVSTVSSAAPSPTEARPHISWDAYNKYISDNAVSPDGKTGAVIVSFTVNGNGALADFKVTQKLSDKVDEYAINLIKNGPTWKGNTNGQAKQINVTVKFHQ